MTDSYFNSRPHGGRPSGEGMTNAERAFQLTPSRRATERGVRPRATLEFQLTPSRRATLLRHPVRRIHNISTHALTEGDSDCMAAIYGLAISTHALTEGDTVCLFQILYLCYFNSRPHGGRRRYFSANSAFFPFQLTPSRRATVRNVTSRHMIAFQLTPSRRATV